MKKIVVTLANQIKSLFNLSLSEAFKRAWSIYKQYTSNIKLIKIYKKDGSLSNRVVHTDVFSFIEYKGVREKIEGLHKFYDLSKNTVISTYKYETIC